MGLLLAHYGGVELMLAARTHVLSPAIVPPDAFSYAFTWLILSCAAVSLLGLFASLRFPNQLPHTEAVSQLDS